MVAVKMGGPMPPMPMGGMPQPLNPLPSPMPVPPMQFGQQPVGALPAQAAGTAPVAPIMRSNAGRRKRFGDSLEGMLATTRPAPVASDQMGGMNVFTGQMPRRQMMGGTAMQPPVRRMMGGGSVPVPRQTDIYGQDHMLAYIRPDEADLLMGLGGAGTPGPGGVPQFGFFDFISDVFSGGKSSNTGGRNKPRGTSSSSPSYASPSNDPYAEDRGGSSSRATNILDTPSQSSADAGRQYAESMIAGGGGTNLSGSGSTAMEKLVAAQQAQTQKDDGPPPDITGSFSSPPSVASQQQDAMDFINQQFYKQQEEQRKNDEIRAAREAQAAAEAEMGLDIFGGAGPDVSIPSAPSIPSGTSIPDELSFQTPFTNTPQVPLNVPNIFNSPFDAAENLRDEMKLRNLEMGEILKLPDELMTEPFNNVTSADPSYVGSGMNPLTAYGGMSYPESEDAFLGVGPIDLTDPRGDEANVMTNYLTDPLTDPLDLGIGEELRPKIRPEGGGQAGTGEQDDRGIVQKFIDDFAAVPGNIMRDIQMGIAAGFYGNYDEARANLEKALNPDGTRKYSDADITSWINRTKETVENNKRQTQGQSTDDDSPMSTSPVDPCPPGFKLDPVSGICVPIEEGEDEGPSLDLNRTRDDEFNELDDIMKRIVKPVGERDEVRTMQAGGSVGLNRVADNFLAAMGA